MLKAKNFNQLKKELKPLEGKAIFKLTRINSMNDGKFLRVLHKIKNNDIIFYDGNRLTHLQFKSAKEFIFFDNGFKLANCTYELTDIMEVR